MPIVDKVATIATKIYGAANVEYSPEAAARVERYTAQVRRRSRCVLLLPRAMPTPCAASAQGFGSLPVCIAKTQYSFSEDRKLIGAPSGHTVRGGSCCCVLSARCRWLLADPCAQLHIRDVRLSAGAGFLYFLVGDQVS
jgi:formyltetrahydrofolate synthetase